MISLLLFLVDRLFLIDSFGSFSYVIILIVHNDFSVPNINFISYSNLILQKQLWKWHWLVSLSVQPPFLTVLLADLVVVHWSVHDQQGLGIRWYSKGATG